jgi:hypothetical protein
MTDAESSTSATTLRDAGAALLLLSVLAGLTTRAPVSPVFVAAALFLALLIHVRSVRTIPRYTKWCGIYYLTAIISALASGMPAVEFLNYDFYRYDGNVFTSFIPFLIAPALAGHRIPVRLPLRILMVTVPAILLISELTVPGLLFRAHNALGGFISVILMVNFVLLKGVIAWVGLGLNLAVLALSESRGSQVGVVLACAALLLYRRGWKRSACAMPVIAVVISLAVASAGYFVWKQIGEPELLDYAKFGEGLDSAELAGATQVGSVAEFGARGGTVSHRVFFIWPLAVADFLASPIVGTGFGRFDDRPEELVGTRNVVALNETPHVVHSDLHAHNSFLHIAAETGVVGIALITGLLVSLWRCAERLRQPYADLVRGLILYCVFASCTEHRLTTPAQMVPAASIMIFLLTARAAQALRATRQDRAPIPLR